MTTSTLGWPERRPGYRRVVVIDLKTEAVRRLQQEVHAYLTVGRLAGLSASRRL